MTARGLYQALLIELNKVNAPSLLLEDYNYFINKAVNQYVNKRYNIYDTTQQTTDDLRVLKATATIPVKKVESYGELPGEKDGYTFFNKGDLFGATYELELPKDYLHMLNCTCVYKVLETYECYPQGRYWTCPATRLTADAWSVVQHNAYMCPSYRRPYYYIHNVNQQNNQLPTNLYDPTQNGTTDQADFEKEKLSLPKTGKYPREIDIAALGNTGKVDLVDKSTYTRAANPTAIRCEIRYGKDDSVFELVYALIDYIKAPQHIKLTQEQIDLTKDTSQVLEFPDYICQEIINELVYLVMENASDPRIKTQPIVSQSIANPAQQQAQSQQQAS